MQVVHRCRRIDPFFRLAGGFVADEGKSRPLRVAFCGMISQLSLAAALRPLEAMGRKVLNRPVM